MGEKCEKIEIANHREFSNKGNGGAQDQPSANRRVQKNIIFFTHF
jgi:hypothetical protein